MLLFTLKQSNIFSMNKSEVNVQTGIYLHQKKLRHNYINTI